MKTLTALRSVGYTCALAAALALGNTARAQTSSTYTPSVGQEGKDVVWVPTPQALVDRMMEMAKVTPADYLVDLGSGDGRTVITAAKRGVQALGIEYNPNMVELSRKAAEEAGVSDRARFQQGDIFESDFSKATVVTMFLLPDLNLRLRPTLLDMKPGTRLVSNSFDMGDWVEDQRVDAGSDCVSYCRAFLWIVPAKVEGNWKLPGGEMVLNQKYQMVSGSITLNGKKMPIREGRLNGNAITITHPDGTLTGQVDGNTMSLDRSAGTGPTSLKATRDQ